MTAKERFEYLADKYYYDEEAAEEKITFIQTHCRHVKGKLAGRNFILEEWQKDEIIRPIFGLKEYEGGPRLINEVYIELPRKNGKTTLAAAIEAAVLFNDGEPGAEIYNCAGDEEQANLLFSITKQMVAMDEDLKRNSQTYGSSIVYPSKNGTECFIRRLSAKPDSKHGFNTHAWFYDELHVAKNRDLYDVLVTSTAERTNPLGLIITTAGNNRQSICWEIHQYALRISKGIYEDDRFWGVIYAAPEDSDMYSEETWRIANPQYDKSENLRRHLRSMVKKCENNPSNENTFKQLHLNIWVTNRSKWLPLEVWRKGERDYDLNKLRNHVAYLGLDTASKRDIVSLSLVIPVDQKVYTWWWMWIPRAMAKVYRAKFNIPYDQWESEGLITLVDNPIIDNRIVKKQILELYKQFEIVSMGHDNYNSYQIAGELQSEVAIECNQRPGGYTLSPANKRCEELLTDGSLIHPPNKIADWMFDNVEIVKNDKLDIKIVKDREETQNKVDGIVSLNMAIAEMEADFAASIYDRRGIKSLRQQ